MCKFAVVSMYLTADLLDLRLSMHFRCQTREWEVAIDRTRTVRGGGRDGVGADVGGGDGT